MTAARLHRLRRAAAACALGLLCASLAGCGQKGPLTLPDSTQPIETLPPTTGAGSPSGTEQSTDENEKKERTENER
jgi:predicted small lipoprotein YifL